MLFTHLLMVAPIQEKARQVERARQETARQSRERRGPERGGPERDFGPSR